LREDLLQAVAFGFCFGHRLYYRLFSEQGYLEGV
jgi:hypothetical protein